MWNTFIKLGMKIASPNLSVGVAATTKSPQSAETKSYILTSKTGVNILTLNDMHSRVGLRVRVR